MARGVGRGPLGLWWGVICHEGLGGAGVAPACLVCSKWDPAGGGLGRGGMCIRPGGGVLALFKPSPLADGVERATRGGGGDPCRSRRWAW